MPASPSRRALARLSVLAFACAFPACNQKTGSDGAASAAPAAMAPSPPREASGPPSAATPGPDRYGAFRSVFTDVARKVIPSVVSISMERTVPGTQDPFRFFFDDPFFGGNGEGGLGPFGQPRDRKESGLGSGFLVDDKGLILTNNHVVEGSQKITVQLSDERVFEAEMVGADKATDLALIRIKKAPAGLVPLRFGDSEKLQIGEWVVAVGAPFGLYESVTTGIISAMGRQNTGITTYGNFLQTDAAINPGNSGGPLVNLDGDVVGINTAIFSQSGGYMGIGFAIPINLARTIQAGLLKDGTVVRGWLGVSIQSMSREMAEALGLEIPEGGTVQGALIGDVVPDSPAEKAGLKRGDLVIRFQGQAVPDANDLMNRVAMLAPGTRVELAILREGKERSIAVTVGKREEERVASQGGDGALASLGIEAVDVDDRSRKEFRLGRRIRVGAVVVRVDRGGPAAGAGIRPGDVILEADRKKIASVADLEKAAAAKGEGGRMLLLVNRGGETFFAVVVAGR